MSNNFIFLKIFCAFYIYILLNFTRLFHSKPENLQNLKSRLSDNCTFKFKKYCHNRGKT